MSRDPVCSSQVYWNGSMSNTLLKDFPDSSAGRVGSHRVGKVAVALTSTRALLVPSEPRAASPRLPSCGRRRLLLKLWPTACAMQGDFILVLASTCAPGKPGPVPAACGQLCYQEAKENNVSFGLRMGDSSALCHLHVSEGFRITSARNLWCHIYNMCSGFITSVTYSTNL